MSDHEDEDRTVSRPWIPDEALAGLNMERQVHASEDEFQIADRLLRENLPGAIAAVAHMALYDANSRIRLDASKYIIDRNLGRVTEQAKGQDDKSLEDFTAAFITEVEVHANASTNAAAPSEE